MYFVLCQLKIHAFIRFQNLEQQETGTSIMVFHIRIRAPRPEIGLCNSGILYTYLGNLREQTNVHTEGND